MAESARLRAALSESAAFCALPMAVAPGTPDTPNTLSFCRWVIVSRLLPPVCFDEHAASATRARQRAVRIVEPRLVRGLIALTGPPAARNDVRSRSPV